MYEYIKWLHHHLHKEYVLLIDSQDMGTQEPQGQPARQRSVMSSCGTPHYFVQWLGVRSWFEQFSRCLYPIDASWSARFNSERPLTVIPHSQGSPTV